MSVQSSKNRSEKENTQRTEKRQNPHLRLKPRTPDMAHAPCTCCFEKTIFYCCFPAGRGESPEFHPNSILFQYSSFFDQFSSVLSCSKLVMF